MKELLENIVSKNFDEANSLIAEQFNVIMQKKLHEMKKMSNAKWCEEQNVQMNKRYPNAASKVRAGINEDDMDKFDDDNDPKPKPEKPKTYRHETSGKEIVHTGTPPEGYKLVKEEELDEKRGLWDNIHAKRERIKRGSGERMRKPGSEGAPSEEDLKNSQTEEALDEASRFKIVKARIRGGKIQRRKKVSTVPGFTFRGGKLTRMTAQERRRRKMGQRRGKLKRKAKLNRALMKRKRSMMKRRAAGLR